MTPVCKDMEFKVKGEVREDFQKTEGILVAV
jgi:hypothetical protein